MMVVQKMRIHACTRCVCADSHRRTDHYQYVSIQFCSTVANIGVFLRWGPLQLCITVGGFLRWFIFVAMECLFVAGRGSSLVRDGWTEMLTCLPSGFKVVYFHSVLVLIV